MIMGPQGSKKYFILTSEAVDVNGQCRLQFWCHGMMEPARIQISQHRPLFFVSRDTVLPEPHRGERRILNLQSMDGNAVDGLYFYSQRDYRKAQQLFLDAGVQTWESDVRSENRFLMERFICGAMEVEGNCHKEHGICVYESPRLVRSDWRPRLSTLSIDVETGRDGTLYSFAVDYSDGKNRRQRVAVLDTAVKKITSVSSERKENESFYLDSERALVEFFMASVKEFDPDIIIGWHVIGFDLQFLENKCLSLGLSLNIGRGKKPLRIFSRPGALPFVTMEGRLVIDGPPALRGAFHKFSDWRLDTVAHELLGRNKIINTHGNKKVEEIERRFREDKCALMAYNLEDAVLVTDIFEITGVLEQLITRSLITGLPVDQVHRSVAAFDSFFLPRLHRKGLVAPNQADIVAGPPSPGAMVFTGGAGLFQDVVVLDFKSLYPTVMQTFNIDPYSLVKAHLDPLETPIAISFSRTEHILPEYIDALISKRAKARESGDPFLANAIKILMNSMYGVMGSSGCRFYRSELPTAITGIGRWVLECSSQRFREWGYTVLYGDTDSVFVQLKNDERHRADQAGLDLVRRINAWFKDAIKTRYGVNSKLEMEYEKRYVRLFLPAMRSSAEGAVKRYAGLLPEGKVDIKGMEFVRSDSSALAREFQYELFHKYFNGQDLKGWIRQVVTDLRNGVLDEKLVYHRRLSQPASKYKSPPPHVRAVRLLDPDGSKNLRRISYIMTPAGPVPVELKPTEIDYSHYIEKQLRPLADDVLSLENESFDSIIGGKQLDLF